MGEWLDYDEGTDMDEETDGPEETEYDYDDDEPCPGVGYNAWQADD